MNVSLSSHKSQSVKSLILYFILILYSLSVFSQKSGQVNFFVHPGPISLKVNKKIIDLPSNKSGNQIELEAGKHIIQLWSPKMEIITDTITVFPDSIITYQRSLTRTNATFDAFRVKKQAYMKEKLINHTIVGVNISLGVVYGILLNEAKKKANDERFFVNRQLNELSTALTETAINDVLVIYESAKRRFEEKRDNYNKTQLIGGIGLITTVGISTWLILKRRKNRPKRPIFKPNPPFSNEHISINYGLLPMEERLNHYFSLHLKF